MMKAGLLMLAAATVLGAQGALEVKNVKLSQDWPWSNKVKLTYDLSGLAEGELAEVVVTATSGGKPLQMYAPGLTGDIYSLDANDSYTISIDPVKAFGKGIELVPDVRMSVTVRAATSASTNVLYKIFDIKNRSVTDVTRGALLNGEWGSVETDFGAIGPGYKTTLEDVVIWTGVTNDVAYKTSKLVVRKIPAGAFKGYKPGAAIPAENNMTWSFDYWIGVFEVTQGQRKELSKYKTGTQEYTFGTSIYNPPGARILGDYLPEQYIQNRYMYGSAQGKNATTSGGAQGFFNYMRQRFTFDGVSPYDFELPTQVQWVRAMRAGADSYYYDGIGNVSSAEQYAVLGNNSLNGGLITHDDGSVTTNIMTVGSFRPNAYGLYDMLGNVNEFFREPAAISDDVFETGGKDVIGTLGGSNNCRSIGGACIISSIGYRKALAIHTAASGAMDVGFRVCMQSMEDGIALITPKTE